MAKPRTEVESRAVSQRTAMFPAMGKRLHASGSLLPSPCLAAWPGRGSNPTRTCSQQKRRSRITVTRQSLIPVYDPRALSVTQLEQAHLLYKELRTVGFLPANRAHLDRARHHLDRAVLCDLLQLHEHPGASRGDFMNTVAVLRTAWCDEPHITTPDRAIRPTSGSATL